MGSDPSSSRLGTAPCFCLQFSSQPSTLPLLQDHLDQSFLSLKHSPIFINAPSSSLISLINTFSPMAVCTAKLGQVPPTAPYLLTPIVPKHLFKDLNTRWQNYLRHQQKFWLFWTNKNWREFWFFLNAFSWDGKRARKKNFLRTTWLFWVQNPSIWSQSARSPRRPYDPASALVMSSHGVVFCSSCGSVSLPSCFQVNPTSCLSNLETVFVVCNQKSLHGHREFLI